MARRKPVKAKAPAQAFEPIGVSGAVITGGYLQSPEKDSRLAGVQKYVTYSEMLVNTSIVAAGTRYFLNLITKSRWKLNPPDDKAKSLKYADKVEEIMHDMTTPWHQCIRRSSMYRFYGFGLQEWTAKMREDGDVGFADVQARPQSTINQWLTDPQGQVIGVIQQSPNTGLFIPIPREKLVYMVDNTLSDTPEGLGIFRHIVEPSRRLKQYELLEGFGLEGDLHGTPVGRAPFALLNQLVKDGVIDESKRTSLIQPLKSFIEGHIKSSNLGLVLDSEMYRSLDDASTVSASPKWDIDVLRVGLGGTLQSCGASIERLNHEIARVLGVEHLLMGGNDRGSYAMSKDKTSNFYLMVDAAIQEIAAVYQTDWLDKLWLLNGWPQECKPEFVPENLKFSDVAQITTALRDMSIAGAVIAPDDPAVDDVRDLLGISQTPDSYEGVPPGGEQPQPAPAPAAAAGGQPAPAPKPGSANQGTSPKPGGQTQGTPKAMLPEDAKAALDEIAALANRGE